MGQAGVYLHFIFSVFSTCEDDSNHIQPKHDTDCAQHNEISCLPESSHLSKHLVEIDRIRCHKKIATKRGEVGTKAVESTGITFRTNLEKEKKKTKSKNIIVRSM